MRVGSRCRAAALLLVLAAMVPSVRANAVSVSAESAVLMCAETGEVLFEKAAHERRPMASTTKIMTALLTLEEACPQRTVVVTPEMVAVEGTSMGLLSGDTVSYYALACGMLLSSGNDAANTAATALCGSLQSFADRMNERAAKIGMTDTHFVTPSGLDDEAHYSTAYDMALLAIEALKNAQFADICARESVRLQFGNPPYPRTLTNHNRLLRLYDGCVGVKTGFTKKSGRCLVSAAKRDGVTLVAVTLRDPDDWNDHIALFEAGFSKVHCVLLDGDVSGVRVPVTGGTDSAVGVSCATEPCALSVVPENVRRTVYLQPFLYAPVPKGTVVGRAVYAHDGKTVCTVDLVTDAEVSARPVHTEPTRPAKSRLRAWIEKIKGVLSSWHRPNVCRNICPRAASFHAARRRS